MALIKCPECLKQISDQARTCPSCGYSLHAITVEQTNKKWKQMQLFGALLVIVGFLSVLLGYQSTTSLGIGIILLFVGLIIILYARGQAWWNHG